MAKQRVFGGFRNALGTFMHCERFKLRPEENDLGCDLDFVFSVRSFSVFSFAFAPYSTYVSYLRCYIAEHRNWLRLIAGLFRVVDNFATSPSSTLR